MRGRGFAARGDKKEAAHCKDERGDGTNNDESLDGVVVVSLMSDADASGDKVVI